MKHKIEAPNSLTLQIYGISKHNCKGNRHEALHQELMGCGGSCS